MIVFGVISALLVVGALLLVVPILLVRREHVRRSRSAINLAIYRDQLRELDADVRNGTLDPEHYRKARSELETRLLEDVDEDEAAATPPRQRVTAAVVVSIAVPLLAFALYFWVGNPQAISPELAARQAAAHGITAQQVEALIERLAVRLKEDPGNPEGWILLARSYGALGRFDEAARAYGNAAARRPRDGALLADYADMLAMAQGRRLQGEPETIIARALEADPDNLKALALAGSAAFEKKDYAGAARHWERMLPLVPPDSENARAIQTNIAEARALGEAAREGRAMQPR